MTEAACTSICDDRPLRARRRGARRRRLLRDRQPVRLRRRRPHRRRCAIPTRASARPATLDFTPMIFDGTKYTSKPHGHDRSTPFEGDTVLSPSAQLDDHARRRARTTASSATCCARSSRRRRARRTRSRRRRSRATASRAASRGSRTTSAGSRLPPLRDAGRRGRARLHRPGRSGLRAVPHAGRGEHLPHRARDRRAGPDHEHARPASTRCSRTSARTAGSTRRSATSNAGHEYMVASDAALLAE